MITPAAVLARPNQQRKLQRPATHGGPRQRSSDAVFRNGILGTRSNQFRSLIMHLKLLTQLPCCDYARGSACNFQSATKKAEGCGPGQRSSYSVLKNGILGTRSNQFQLLIIYLKLLTKLPCCDYARGGACKTKSATQIAEACNPRRTTTKKLRCCA